MRRPNELLITVLIVFFAVPAHLIGLIIPALYRDPAIVIPQNLATDLVVLALGIPTLIGSTIFMRRSSLGARILWLGTLGFLAYAYGMYALAVSWNPLFLVYLALFGLSLFGFVLGVAATDAVRIRLCFSGTAPVKLVAGYLIGCAVLVGALWLAEEVGAVVGSTVPPSVVQFETPTNIVHVFDLALVLPAMVLSAFMLLRDRPWGFVWAGILLVKATTIAIWVVGMIWFSGRRGFPSPTGYTLFFIALAISSAGLTALYLSRITSRRGGPRVPSSSGMASWSTVEPAAR